MTDAVLLTEPEVAVIVADPVATEVTSPADETVAIDELDVAHVTVGLEITDPPVSLHRRRQGCRVSQRREAQARRRESY